MSNEVLTAIISAITTLMVSIGTWHVSMRQYRAKNEEMVDRAISDIKDSVTKNHADTKEHLALIDLKIETLSNRVEKHNQVIDRTYKLESDVKLNTAEINHLKEKLA